MPEISKHFSTKLGIFAIKTPRSKKQPCFAGKSFLSLTRSHSQMCIRIHFFLLEEKQQKINKKNKQKNKTKRKQTNKQTNKQNKGN